MSRFIQILLVLALAISLPAWGASIGAVASSESSATIPVIEYYNAALDHYFITADPAEINALDSGAVAGWTRTTLTFYAYSPTYSGSSSPVCRFYGLPSAGLDSHFYTASDDECMAVVKKFATSWTLESSDVFRVILPDSATGECPASTFPVYRLFNNRTDVNHRYTIDFAVRQAMVAKGYTSEGYGDYGVAFCGPPGPATVATATSLSPAIEVTQTMPAIFNFDAIAAAAPQAQIVSYAWDFGDGSAGDGSHVQHTFSTTGTFPVVLTVADNKGNVGRATKAVQVAPATSNPSTNSNGDFAARRTTAGVFRSFSFDTADQFGIDLNNGSPGYTPTTSYGYQSYSPGTPALDYTDSASGPGASLNFTFAPNSSQAYAGKWTTRFSDDDSLTFGPNSEFYVQFRYKHDGMLNNRNANPEGVKMLFLSANGDVASGSQSSDLPLIVFQFYYTSGQLIPYTYPGYPGHTVSTYTLQDPYKSPANGAVPSNEWVTFDIHVQLGNILTASPFLGYAVDATVTVDMIRADGTKVRVVTYGPSNPGPDGYFGLPWDPTGVQKYGKLTFLPYTTSKDATITNPVYHMHYDELIMSTRPIPDPGATAANVSGGEIATTGVSSTGKYPAWRAGKPVGQWVELAGTANLSGAAAGVGKTLNVDPTYIIDVWNGLAASPTAFWSAGAGGHGVPLNAVLNLELSSDAPRWTLVDPGSKPADLTNFRRYADGRISSRHTYYSTHFVSGKRFSDGKDRIVVLTAYATYANDAWSAGDKTAYVGGPQVDTFRIADKVWDDPSTFGDLPLDGGQMSGGTFQLIPTQAKDPNTEMVYLAGNYQFVRWNPLTRKGELLEQYAPATHNSGALYPDKAVREIQWGERASVVDSKRNRFVTVSDGYAYDSTFMRLEYLDLTTYENKIIAITGTLTPDKFSKAGALIYDPDNDRYILFQTGATATAPARLYAINPDSGASTFLMEAPTPSPAYGIYSRAAYFPGLGGIGYLPHYSSNVWFLPTR